MAIAEADTGTAVKARGGIRLRLNLKAISDEATHAMAGMTLKALLEEQEKRVANPEAGDRMPDGSVFAGKTPGDVQLFAMPQNAGVKMDFNEASAYVKQLNDEKALGHDDWRVPTAEELNVLFINRAKIGGFEVEKGSLCLCFWSCTPYGGTTNTLVYFDDGKQVGAGLQRTESVRAVRSGNPYASG